MEKWHKPHGSSNIQGLSFTSTTLHPPTLATTMATENGWGNILNVYTFPSNDIGSPQIFGRHTAHCDNRIQRKGKGGNRHSYGGITEAKHIWRFRGGTEKVRIYHLVLDLFIFSERPQNRLRKHCVVRSTFRRTCFHTWRHASPPTAFIGLLVFL